MRNRTFNGRVGGAIDCKGRLLSFAIGYIQPQNFAVVMPDRDVAIFDQWAAFEAILAGATEEYRTAKRADFEPNYVEDAVRLGGGELGVVPDSSPSEFAADAA